MILSVIIISHNQREQVKRCIESVLSQDLPFECEIVISDDASTDGTWELEQEYAANYPFIKAYQCNSNDCNPTYGSERSGHNRSNAYRHASGKYFCHIDGDDYYRPGSSCLKEMVALLEDHPECSICMQNGWVLKDGARLEEGSPFYEEHRFNTGQVLTAKEYLQSGLFVNNGAMMMRRNAAENPANLYHKWYVDSVITAHHLQFGSIVCLDSADWVYVQYPSTVTSSLCQDDKTLIWNLDLTVFLSLMVPRFKRWYYNASTVKGLKSALKLILARPSLSEGAKAFCKQFDKVFVYNAALKPYLSARYRTRLRSVLLCCSFIQRFRFYGSGATLILDRLCR